MAFVFTYAVLAVVCVVFNALIYLRNGDLREVACAAACFVMVPIMLGHWLVPMPHGIAPLWLEGLVLAIAQGFMAYYSARSYARLLII